MFKNSIRLYFFFVTLLFIFGSLQVMAANHTTKVGDGVYTYGPGDGYFSMFIVTSEGVIAIEPVDTKHATGFVAAIKAITNKPIRYLLHSHNHWDHARGGKVFEDAGAKVLAHKEAYVWMKANPKKGLMLPHEYWDGKRKDITLGSKTIELHYLGMGHGLGMTVFLIPAQKIIYIADLVTPKRVSFSIMPDFNIKEWKRSLSYIENQDFNTAVFSHSGSDTSTHIGNKLDVIHNREFIEDMQAAIIAEFKKGTYFTKIPAIVRLPQYKNWAMYDEWLHLNAWRIMLDMHMGPFPWRPPYGFENKK